MEPKIPTDLYERLHELSVEQGLSEQQLVVRILEQGLAEHWFATDAEVEEGSTQILVRHTEQYKRRARGD